jgi:FkbM family methyltransferase
VFIGNYYNRTAFEIQPNDIVLDIGAYIGDFTVFAAKKALNGKVFSFEPIKELYQLARFNTAQNNCANVQLFPFGLSSRTGVEQFKVDASKPLADTSAYSLSSNAKTIKGLVINGTSFLQACDSIKPTYVKIDCEGAEFDILYNLKRKYFKSVRVMIVEYHEIFADAKKTGAELKKYLEKLDFEVTDTGGLVFSTIGLLYCKNRKPL